MYGAKCYQKNPEHKSKFKHSAREQEEKENRENQADVVDKGVLSPTVNAENNKRQHSDSDDLVEAKKAKNLHSSDADGVVDDKEAKHHDLSDSEEGDASQVEEEVDALLGLEMPPDFYSFWDFACTVNKENPLLCLSSVGLKLCGAFEILAGTVPSSAPRSRSLYLTHHRFHYDSPELQTLICETSYAKGVHLGYFRDIPTQTPSLVMVGVESQGAKLTALGDNLFAGVYNYLVGRLEEGDPFLRTKVTGMMEKIKP